MDYHLDSSLIYDDDGGDSRYSEEEEEEEEDDGYDDGYYRPDSPQGMSLDMRMGMGGLSLGDELAKAMEVDSGLGGSAQGEQEMRESYEGDGYGDPADDSDDPALPLQSLDARIAELRAVIKETFAAPAPAPAPAPTTHREGRRTRDETKGDDDDDDAIRNLIVGLQARLGDQSAVENGASRLITVHAALTSSLTHKSRQLGDMKLALPFLPDIAEDDPPPPPLHSLLNTLQSLIPPPSLTSLSALHALHTQTTSLVSTLSSLSDSIQEIKQTEALAGRKLKVVMGLVEEWQVELAGVERSRAWISSERNRWKVGGVVGRELRSVIGGFEEVVRGMEKRIEAW
ncbi:hypothetical protein YB2330_001779 [Saitoella coloradoensis]